MLAKINHIFGLVENPELSYSQDGKAICKLNFACSEKWNDNETKFYMRAVAFGKGGEAISKYFQKGSRIFISGKLSPNNYEKDGKTIYGYQIIVESFDFVDRKSDNQQSGQSAPAQNNNSPFDTNNNQAQNNSSSTNQIEDDSDDCPF